MAKKLKKSKKPAKIKKSAKAKPAKKSAKAAKKSSSPKIKKIASRKSAPVKMLVMKTTFTTNATRIPKAKEIEEKPLTASEVSKFRDILTQKRDDLLAVVQRKKELEIQTIEEEIGDEADVATRSVEREMLFELTDSEKQTIDMIEASLRKIEKGVFGRCESCLKTIPRLRMEVMPWARYCIQCQAQQEIPSSPSAPSSVE